MLKMYINNKRNLLFTVILLISFLSSSVINGQQISKKSQKSFQEGISELSKFAYTGSYNDYSKIPYVMHPTNNIKVTSVSFDASEKEGIIGILSDADKENPNDNFFTVEIPEGIDLSTTDVVLKYSLYGVEAAGQTTKSINNSAVYGGQSIKLNNSWNEVVEYLPSGFVKTGENEIFFNRRSDIAYQYTVKNLSIELVEKRSRQLFLADNTVNNYNGTIHLLGFANETVKNVSVLGQTVEVKDGMFEYILEDVNENVEQLTISYGSMEAEKGSEIFNVEFHSETVNYTFPDVSTETNNSWSAAKALEFISFSSITDDKSATPFVNANLHVTGLDFKELRPLNSDVENVTSGMYSGFRTKSNIENQEEELKIHLRFDESMIPGGYSTKDVRTFAFDQEKREWTILQVDSLDYVNKVIVSKYKGDTDYINGVIKVPEMAETTSFTPTTITDMKYADPGAGVVSIAPPSVSNTGVASTGFPIKLPAGRNGMAPSLGVNYSSEAGNSWMGVGWNMQLPAITLDTRWGVPRFNSSKETEIYQMNGEDLVLKVGNEYTSPHRHESDISRNTSGNKIFYLRKEGSYEQIIRYGTSPTNYRWRVTDKYGNRSYYGGTEGSVDNATVIRDGSSTSGNITHWALRHTVDPFGNYVRYTYTKGTANINGVQAQYFYPNWIRYTLKSGATSNYYQVDFKRNTYSVGTGSSISREDVTTDARTGVLMANKDLLTEVKVSFRNGALTTIRTYRFDYEESAFKKMQLSKIAEYDTEDNLFYSNTMEYYDEVGNGALIDNSPVTWDGVSNSIFSPLLDIATSGFLGLIPDGTALGAGTSSGFSLGLRVGVGLGWNPTSVAFTLGGSYNYSQSKEKTQISFLDVNGDGLPDKIYKSSAGSLKYLPNLGINESGQGVFGSPKSVSGLDQLSETKSRTNGLGFDANAAIIGVGASWSRTRTATDDYFIDFNGDGLPDMVTGGTVKFNTTPAWNNPTFVTFNNDVGDTQNPIISGAVNPSLIDDLDLESLDELRADHSQFDHIRAWKAPYAGVIKINGTAWLRDKNDCGEPGALNRFRLTIEKGVEEQTSPATVLSGSTKYLNNIGSSQSYNLNSISVNKGDLFFFRAHNETYGCGGEIEWNPDIEYTSAANIPNTIDEHDNNFREFSAEDDYIMNNGGSWGPSADDNSVSINFNITNSTFSAYELSDAVNFRIERLRFQHDDDGMIIEGNTQTLEWTKTYNPTIGNITGPGAPGGFLNVTGQYINDEGPYSYAYRFYVESETNVQWDLINWQPTITGSGTGTVNYPSITYCTYEDNVNQSKYWYNSSSFVNPIIDNTDPNDPDNPLHRISHNMFDSGLYTFFLGGMEDEDFPVKITWAVKEDLNDVTKTLTTKTYYLHRLNCTFGVICDYQFRTSIDPSGGVEIDASDIPYYQYNLTKGEVEDIKDGSGRIYSGFYIDVPVFGQGNPANITLALHPNEVGNYTHTPQVLNAPFIAKNVTFFGITYRGWGQYLYNGGSKFDYTEEGDQIPGTYQVFSGPIDMSVFDYGADPNAIEDDINNADPDDVDINSITVRYTYYGQDNPDNSYRNYAIKHYLDEGVRLGYNTSNEMTFTTGRFGEYNLYDLWTDPNDLLDGSAFAGLKQRTFSKGKAKSGNLGIGPLGVSGTISDGSSKVLNQYIDLNGDRYPDIVTDGKIQFTNIRGSLSNDAQDNISNGFVSGGESHDETQGVNIAGMFPNSTESDNGSVSNETRTNINGGINSSNGESFDSRQWSDINGDGLPDRVRINETEVRVELNTGYGFSNEIVWGDGYSDLYTSIRSSAGIGGGIGNASFSFGFGAGESTANMNAALVDVNGDGLPDLVVKNSATYKYYLNNGTEFEDSAVPIFYNGNSIDQDHSFTGNIYGSYTYGFTIPLWFIVIKVTFTPTVGLNAGVNEKRITIQDIDGDGFVDVLQSGADNGDVVAKLNKVGKTNYLKTVNTPLGGSWTVDYEREGNTYDLPSNKYVLSKITTYDGFVADNAYGLDHTLTTVSYEDPQYDRRERQFLGFGEVKVNQNNPVDESVYRYSVSEYHNENVYLQGLTKGSSSLEEDGTVLNESTTLYNIMNPDNPITDLFSSASNEYLQSGLDASQLDHDRLFVAPVKKIITTYENDESLSIEEQMTHYDQYGNLLVYKNLGDTYTTVPGTDAFRTEIDYYSTIPSVINSKGFAKEVRVVKDDDNALLRKREAAYYKGKLSEIKIQLNETETNVVDLDYDIFGNMESANQINGFNTSMTYENVLNTYPIVTTNTHGYTSSAQYNYLFGTPVLSTDINGQQLRTRIDNRGRVVEVTAPNEMPDNWTLRMQYQGEVPIPTTFTGSNYVIDANGSFSAINPGGSQPTAAKHHAITRHFVEQAQDNQLLTISLVDGLGGEIQLKKTLFANSNSSSQLRWMISGKAEKDAFGRVLKSYLPTTQTGYPSNSYLIPPSAFNYESGQNTLPPALCTYDSKNRKVSVTQPGESESLIYSFDIEDGMFSTTNVNELDQTSKSFIDVKGRLRKTVINNELTSRFYYNTLGEKIKVKNHQGYETFYYYDIAGRSIEERHPDKGISIFEYDLVGNLVKQYTSNLIASDPTEAIVYSYNYNQLKEIIYPQNPENNIKYTYGSSGVSDVVIQNAIGRLYMQEDASGVQGFGYDKLGNLANHLRGVAVANRHTFWFHTEWDYDSHNRIKMIRYPDLETVLYNYNEGGTLSSVRRSISGVVNNALLIQSIKYNDLGEKVQINYGNGTSCSYIYDSRRRLEDLGHQFIGFGLTNRYTYDALSNVSSVQTLNPAGSVPVSGKIGGPVSHNYEYDQYNRLIHAEGRFTGNNDYGSQLLAQEYSLDMEYDLAHNITSKVQTHNQGSVASVSSPINVPEVMPKTNYNLSYEGYASGAYIVQGQSNEFGYVQPHAVREILETPNIDGIDESDPRVKKKFIDYDANGNQLSIKELVYDGDQSPADEGLNVPDTITLHKNLWDEENRLRAVDLNPDESKGHPLAVYTYDASGNRIVRYVPGRLDAWSNGVNIAGNIRDEAVLYPSPMITVKALSEPGVVPTSNDLVSSYTKHYYVGSEKITSTIGTLNGLGLFPRKANQIFPGIRGLANQSVQSANLGLIHTYQQLNQEIEMIAPVIEEDLTNYNHKANKFDAYWYHKDHLGSSSYVSNTKGLVSQHIEYLPFGESLVDEHLNSYNTPYKFNGKELDEETGNYYYGARYYNPKMSVWLSIDPLAHKYPYHSPYCYVLNNPIRYIDPDGMKVAPKSQKQWDNHKKNISNKRAELQTEVNGLEQKAQDKGWNSRKLNRKTKKLKGRISSLSSSLDKMTELENSEDTYSLQKRGADENGTVKYNSTSKAVDIHTDGSTSEFIHELDHAYQIESGNAIAYMSGYGAWDLGDEVEAYKSQFAYDPDNPNFVDRRRSAFDKFRASYITKNWVKFLNSGLYSGHSSTSTSLFTTREELLELFPNATLPENYSIINDPNVHVPSRFKN